MAILISRDNPTRAYWTLSEKAKEIITLDWRRITLQRADDKKIKISKFVNIIFFNYKDMADSSVKLRMNRDGHLSGFDDKKYNELCGIMYKIIEEKYLSSKGMIQKIRIHKPNIEYMRTCGEDYDSAGVYFRAVLEEYATLSVAERERIIFKDHFEAIEKAYINENLLTVEVDAYNGPESHSFYPIYPCKMSNDGSAYYAVGIEVTHDKGDEIIFTPYTVKVSQIDCILSDGRDRKHLSEQLKEKFDKVRSDIDNDLIYADASFVRFKVIKAKVKLTENGLRKLYNISHNRPNIICRAEESDDEAFYLCEFKCTAEQLMFYFQDFGKEAVIVSPEEVRQKMTDYYLSAYNAYTACE